jgi:hypothetical protein
MPEHQGGESYQLDLVALRDGRGVPPHVRLKTLLKHLLRTHRFRCTGVRDTTPRLPPLQPQDGPATAPEAAEATGGPP